MKKTLLALGLAAILLTGCDGPTKVAESLTSGTTVVSVSADTRHTMTLDSLGVLYANGWNEEGALGNGIALKATIMSPTKVLSNVKDVDTGFNFTVIVKKDGTLWGTGDNAVGQLGIGSNDDASIFTQAVDNLGKPMTGVSSVYTEGGFTLALKTDGTLWATGQNGSGQLGLGDNIDKNCFYQVTLADKVKLVATGHYHSIIVLENGDILTTGDNWFGELGNGLNGNSTSGTWRNLFTKVSDESTLGKIVSVAANTVGSFVVNESGDVYVAGDNFASGVYDAVGDVFGSGGLGMASTHTFTKVSSLSGIKKVEAKYTTVAVTTSTGDLYVSGTNGHGQLGTGNTLTGTTADYVTEFTKVSSGVKVGDKKVSTGNFTSFYINNSGILYGTGDNWFGNLGKGDCGAGTSYLTFKAVTK